MSQQDRVTPLALVKNQPTSSGEHMQTVVDAWIDTYRAAGKSEGTIRTRLSYLRAMVRTGIDPLTVTPDALQAYLASRSELSPEGRKSMMVTLRSFYKFSYRRGYIALDLAEELPSVSVPKGVSKPITEAALATARALADTETMLMLDLGTHAGLRRSEMANVHASHVGDFGLVVKGKGGVTRLVPIHPRLHERLYGLEGWAFPSPIRAGQPVTPDYIADRLERVLPRPFSPHSLRHYAGTKWYQASHDITAVQHLLGHADVSTTMRYIQVNHDALTAAVNAVA